MVSSSEEPARPIASAAKDELAAALRVAVAAGLPIDREADAGMLLQLRSVYARAVVPSEPLSRLHALNTLVPRLIASLDDVRYREAAQALFGLAPGTRKTSLTARRRAAASVLDYSTAHFRTDVERDVIHAVAMALHQDLLRYQSRVKRASESLEPSGDTPALGPEHINAEEELVSRIWQHVYGLRAELIATLRLSEAEGFEAQVEDHLQAALREQTELRKLIAEYTETYGAQLIRHGEAEFVVEALERLVGWQLSPQTKEN